MYFSLEVNVRWRDKRISEGSILEIVIYKGMTVMSKIQESEDGGISIKEGMRASDQNIETPTTAPMRAANQPASTCTAALLCVALAEALVEVLVEDFVVDVVREAEGVDVAGPEEVV